MSADVPPVIYLHLCLHAVPRHVYNYTTEYYVSTPPPLFIVHGWLNIVYPACTFEFYHNNNIAIYTGTRIILCKLQALFIYMPAMATVTVPLPVLRTGTVRIRLYGMGSSHAWQCSSTSIALKPCKPLYPPLNHTLTLEIASSMIVHYRYSTII